MRLIPKSPTFLHFTPLQKYKKKTICQGFFRYFLKIILFYKIREKELLLYYTENYLYFYIFQKILKTDPVALLNKKTPRRINTMPA